MHQEHFNPIADPDHQREHHDRRLQLPEAQPIQRQYPEHANRRSNRRQEQHLGPAHPRRQQPSTQQQIEPQSRTQKLRQVGSESRKLRSHP